MKRLVIVLLLAALVIGAFGACTRGPTDLDDYNALIAELSELMEYQFVGNAVISLEAAFLGDAEFLFEDFMPIHYSVDGTASLYHRQMQATYRYLQDNGMLMFDETMFLTGDNMYIGVVSRLDYMMRPTFEEMGFDLTDFSMAEALGGYDYMIVPYEGEFTDMVFAPTNVTGGIDPAPFLTRQGNAFIVTVLGEDVRMLTNEMGEMLSQFVMDEATGGDELSDMGSRLAEADLTGARVVVITSHEEATFHQTVEMEVPGFIEMQANLSFTPQAVPVASPPDNALNGDDFADLLAQIDLDALFGAPQPDIEDLSTAEDVTIIEDLGGLNLTNHELDYGSLLQNAALGNGHGGENIVSVIAGRAVIEGDYHLVCDADAIEMIYISLDDMNAVQSVLLAVEQDRMGYFQPDSALTFSTLRTNEERSAAAMIVVEETTAGMIRVCVYLAQVIAPTGDVIRLEMVLYMDLFADQDHAILAELSDQIGLNLGDWVSALMSVG